jgi:phosphopantothenoylcysteine decarboxylase / phosphopantothenate---cysteine ligase
MLNNKTIIVGVTGGIAAYKSCALVSRLKELGADVWVVMTAEATKLVAPLTFRTLSGNPVVTDLFSEELSSLPVPHISLADKADLIVIAPATANIIGKIAHGIADDPLSTIVMASTANKLLAPAMNCNMWRNPAVAQNFARLQETGFETIGPEEGKLACGDYDIGRMSEPSAIVEKILTILNVKQDLKGKKLLITAGGTREAIDPVRFISNRSSGKMGYALAEAARRRGAEVTLISAPTNLEPPAGMVVYDVVSAREMHEAVMSQFRDHQVIIMAAAVADYRPSISFFQKLKKESATFNLELSKTVDILAALGEMKNGSLLVGFAAESDNHLENAKEKLKKKNLDLIVANDIAALDADRSQVNIIDRRGNVEALPELEKHEVADRILDRIIELK